MCIYMGVKKLGHSNANKMRKIWVFICMYFLLFFLKKRVYHIPGGAEKGGYVIYRESPQIVTCVTYCKTTKSPA